MINTIVAIACGGALGALARHGVSAASFRILGPDFPWGTMVVNIAGSFLMGLLIAIFAHVWQPAQEIRVFLVTGFLGAFTTFSAFSLDVSTLWERQALMPLAGYILFSVILSIGALFAAMALVRQFVS